MAHPVRWACLCLMLTVMTSAAADWRTTLPTAQRLGQGDFTWFGLRLYTARLWTAGPVQDWNQPFALELLYHRSISRETLVQASLEEMQRLGPGSLTAQSLEAWTQAMQVAFVDVRPGMRITGLYLPGKGCRFYVDGKLSHEVADPSFARAFFAIWLDPRARDPQLRQRLLGLADNDRGT
ncbi:chalcone isomerase family protein [Pseudomonas sp. P97.38]|uniref:chalcone isomerase family protein n=1 Tax=Pseudomonas sp. P97.38 TaxID=255451 RepID=UPI00069E9801|nr:chalcone isomerase family protein [Pseudomonas sp. P97.38]